MTPEIQAIVSLAREAAASVRPSSTWAKRVLAGQRDDDDAVRAALAALKAAPTSDGEAIARHSDALAKAFCLLDTFAGEGVGHTYGNGQTIMADDAVTEIAEAFGFECEPGWWRGFAALLSQDRGEEVCTPSAAPVGDLREGFLLVPREPTMAMLDEACGVSIAVYPTNIPSGWTATNHDEARGIWAAMLAASPVPVDAEGFVVTDADIELGARQMRAVLDDGGYDDETALYSAIETMGGRVVDNANAALAAAPKAADLQTGE